MINTSKPTTTMTNPTRVSFGETWASILTTWASETRTWARTSSLLTNVTKQSSSMTNVSKPDTFTPSSIAGLQLWFDATKNVYSDSGTTLCTNGDPVQQWNDQSSSAKNLTGSSTARPTYHTNVQNGLPSITFDGVNDVMVTASMTLGQPLSVFVVINQPTWSQGLGMFDGISTDTMLLYQQGSTPQLRMYGTAGGADVNLTTLAVNTWAVIDLRYNATSSFYRLNNASKVTISTNITGSPGGLTLGKEVGYAFGNVSFGEFLIYNSAISDADATSINRYLGNKWGITVS